MRCETLDGIWKVGKWVLGFEMIEDQLFLAYLYGRGKGGYPCHVGLRLLMRISLQDLGDRKWPEDFLENSMMRMKSVHWEKSIRSSLSTITENFSLDSIFLSFFPPLFIWSRSRSFFFFPTPFLLLFFLVKRKHK